MEFDDLLAEYLEKFPEPCKEMKEKIEAIRKDRIRLAQLDNEIERKKLELKEAESRLEKAELEVLIAKAELGPRGIA